jgi:hypothetical protein
MIIERSLPVWEGPRRAQEQFNRRLAEINGNVESLNAKFADFLDQHSKDEMLAVTLGLVPGSLKDAPRCTLSPRSGHQTACQTMALWTSQADRNEMKRNTFTWSDP